MRRMLVLLGCLIAGTWVAEAQETAPASGETSSKAAKPLEPVVGPPEMIIELLKLSHEQDQVLSVPVRLQMLRMQTQMMLPLDAALARVWAEEIFRVSQEGTPGDRESAQQFSLGLLAEAEPDRALVLLHSMKTEDANALGNLSPPKLQIVARAFAALARRDGASALPRLEDEAARLGAEGQYPYLALGQAAVQSVNDDWGKDNDHAVEVVKRAYEKMFARYSQGSRGYPDDFQFGEMLGVVSGAVPPEVVRPGVRALVKSLLAMNDAKYQPAAEVFTKDGQSVKSENGTDAGILFFGGVIQRVDPELAQELETTRLGLRNLEYTKDGMQTSMKLGWKNLRPSDPSEEARSEAVRVSRVNADTAMAKAAQLPDDERRAATLLDMARGMAGYDPGKAALLIEEASGKSADDAMNVNVASARAYVAAGEGKKKELRENLRQGFSLAGRVFAEQERTGLVRLVAGLPQMVQLGAQYELEITTSFVQSMPASYEKAMMFFGMANVVQGAPILERRRKVE